MPSKQPESQQTADAAALPLPTAGTADENTAAGADELGVERLSADEAPPPVPRAPVRIASDAAIGLDDGSPTA